MTIPESHPEQIPCRDHKKFNSLKFIKEWKNVLMKENIDNRGKFEWFFFVHSR